MALRLSLLVALVALAATANAYYTANVFIVNLSGEEMIFGGCATSVNNTLPVAPQSIPVGQVRHHLHPRGVQKGSDERGRVKGVVFSWGGLLRPSDLSRPRACCIT